MQPLYNYHEVSKASGIALEGRDSGGRDQGPTDKQINRSHLGAGGVLDKTPIQIKIP